jgi:6-phosphogluconolactonase
MRVEVLGDADAAARRAAAVVAAEARAAVAARGQFVAALSRAPRAMLEALAGEDVPWSGVHLLQVDERVAPSGARDRNLTELAAALLARSALSAERLHAMPVDAADLAAAAAGYGRLLGALAGEPPAIDLVHLGLGGDGHTASLFHDDPVLAVRDDTVALTGEHAGWRRMTLTLPVLDRARMIVWLVTGRPKARVLARLLDHDPAIPAGRIRHEAALVLADASAASA